MATFIDFSFAVDAAREKRLKAERTAKAERVDAEIAAKERHLEQEAARRRQGLDELYTSTVGIDRSLPTTPSAIASSLTSQAAGIAPTTAEQVPTLARLSRRQRAKELFRPGLRKKRIAEEFAIAQLSASEAEQPIETPPLPGAGLLKLQAREKMPFPASPMEEQFDADMTQGGDDDEITALPPLPGYRYQMFTYLSSAQVQADEASVKDLAGQAMSSAEAAYDAPGNRSSIRLPLSAEWTVTRPEFSRVAGISSSGQLPSPAHTAFLPLPDLSLPGPPLPDLSMPDVRSATARGEADE